MLAGTSYRVKFVLEQSANYTHFEKASVWKQVAQGEYCYVLLGGFFSDSLLEHLPQMQAECAKGGAQLIGFPCYTEKAELVQKARLKLPDTPFILWGKEISSLISSGVPQEDMISRYQNKYNRPLAGYVGAHMIYRALFNKFPPEIAGLGGVDPLSFDTIKAKLGSYVTAGLPAKVQKPEPPRTVYTIS